MYLTLSKTNATALQFDLIESNHPSWRAQLDELYAQLGGSANATLLPYHFLQAALPHIGGKVLVVVHNGVRVGALFALPTPGLISGTKRQPAYVIRQHSLPGALPIDEGLLKQGLAAVLGTETLDFFDPGLPHPYQATHSQIGALDIGRPDATEAESVRWLQQEIWRSPAEFLYPIDLHSTDFPIGTSLVARVDGEVAGFLFGFYKGDKPTLPHDWAQRWGGELRIESQVMGVLPQHRGLRIGYLLKRAQGDEALRQGIGVINWTVDPLQYANAALNFGLLRAVAFNFTPDYYPFRNELNRGPASRFSLTWLIGSGRVLSQPLFDVRSTVIHLAHQPEIVRVNQGWQHYDLTVDANLIAIEVPSNWTGLQQTDADAALGWRTVTDQLFAHYIGSAPGKYVVTDVGVDGDARYLIAERASEGLWSRLGQP